MVLKGEKTRTEIAILRNWSHADGDEGKKGPASEVSDGKKKYFIGHWRKDHSCQTFTEKLGALCPCSRASWKAEFKCDVLDI